MELIQSQSLIIQSMAIIPDFREAKSLKGNGIWKNPQQRQNKGREKRRQNNVVDHEAEKQMMMQNIITLKNYLGDQHGSSYFFITNY